jgi:splicing factor U2AF subunit
MPEQAAAPPTSRVLSLREAVTVEELQNDEEYNDIVEDMREECSKVGSLCDDACAWPPV